MDSEDMLELGSMERGALTNFLAGSESGPLRSALQKFTAYHARRMNTACSVAMASVPRSVEQASDCAAKAQLLNEFWELLTDAAAQQGAGVESSQQ